MPDEPRPTLTLRPPRALLNALKKEADKRSHSMNAEIIRRLEESFSPPAADQTGRYDLLRPEDRELLSSLLSKLREGQDDVFLELKLNALEIAELIAPVEGIGGFQALLLDMRTSLDPATGVLRLVPKDVVKIIRAFSRARGGYPDRLRRIFQRALIEAVSKTSEPEKLPGHRKRALDI